MRNFSVAPICNKWQFSDWSHDYKIFLFMPKASFKSKFLHETMRNI